LRRIPALVARRSNRRESAEEIRPIALETTPALDFDARSGDMKS